MKYFLKAAWQEEFQEVERSQYLTAESNAGFRSKVPGTPATGYFNSGGTEGRIEYEHVVAHEPSHFTRQED